MEHLNRDCKCAISGLGANITDHSVERISKCLGRMHSIVHQFDTDNCVKEESGSHTTTSTEVDSGKVVEQLQKVQVFKHQPGRTHKNFPKFTTNINKLSGEHLLQWMQDRMQQLIMAAVCAHSVLFINSVSRLADLE